MNAATGYVVPPFTTTSSRLSASKCISTLARSGPPCTFPTWLDHSLQVNVQTRMTTATKFAQLWPPSAFPSSLDHRQQVRTIRASKLVQLWPWSASHSSLDHSVVRWCSSQGDSPSSTLHHISHDIRWECLRKSGWGLKRVRGYERIPHHDEQLQLRGSMNALQEWVKNHTKCVNPSMLSRSVRRRAGNDRVCIWYNVMLSIYPKVSQIYTLCCWLCCHCIPVCQHMERHRWYMPSSDVTYLETVRKMQMIHLMPCGCGIVWTSTVRICLQVLCGGCSEVSPAPKFDYPNSPIP